MEHEADIEFSVIDRDFLDMQETLANDVQLLVDQLTGNDIQVLRRAVYGALFAYIEGMVFSLKKEIMLLRKQVGWEPRGKEKRLLTEKKEIVVNGETIVTRTYHVSLSRSIPYAFREYAFMHWFDFEIDTEDGGWKALLEAQAVRNRLTHPKYPRDLIIADKELLLIVSGASWFDNNLKTLFAECAKVYFRRFESFKDRVQGN
jgi:hypothetical protein